MLINLAIVSRLDLLRKLSDFDFCIPLEVLNEIKDPTQKERVNAEIATGGLRTIKIESVEELQAYAEYAEQFGKGEAASLAVAKCRDWVIATDEIKDKRLTREITERGIQVVNTPGILLKAIKQGLLSEEEADAIKTELERNRFRMKFESFREVVESED